MCHSLRYVTNQGPKSKKLWNGKVVKMVKSYKTPIREKDIKLIIDYLFEVQGNRKLK